MIYDTAGNKIKEPIITCNCGLTDGCDYCKPKIKERRAIATATKEKIYLDLLKIADDNEEEFMRKEIIRYFLKKIYAIRKTSDKKRIKRI